MKRFEIRLSDPDQALMETLVRTTSHSRATIIRKSIALYHFCRTHNITGLTSADGSTTAVGWK